MKNAKSIIRSLDENGTITEHAMYTLPADKALICYLEQTINNNYNTYGYWENFIDAAGLEYQTKSKFLDVIKPLPSNKGYGIDLGEKVICAYQA